MNFTRRAICLSAIPLAAGAVAASAQNVATGAVTGVEVVDMDADGWPKCDRKPDCRFMATGSRSTLLGWAPTIDRNGNVSGKDPNTTTTDYACMTCGKRFTKAS